MSLKDCPACGTKVSKSAASCPACGHPMKAKSSGCGVLLALGLLMFSAVMLLTTCQESGAGRSPSSAIPSPSAADVAAAREATKIEAARLNALQAKVWRYSANQDEMSAGRVFNAELASVNSFEFGSPYGGSQRGRLFIRQHPKHGTDVIVAIERGQIICPIRDCAKSIRFDDGTARDWRVLKPENHASEMVFIGDARRFIQQMTSAKVVRIQLNIYQESPVTLEFDVSEFDPVVWKGGESGTHIAAPESQGRS